MQKMDRVKVALRQVFRTREDACDQIFRIFSSGKTETSLREHSGQPLSQNSEQGWQEFYSKNDSLSTLEIFFE